MEARKKKRRGVSENATPTHCHVCMPRSENSSAYMNRCDWCSSPSRQVPLVDHIKTVSSCCIAAVDAVNEGCLNIGQLYMTAVKSHSCSCPRLNYSSAYWSGCGVISALVVLHQCCMVREHTTWGNNKCLVVPNKCLTKRYRVLHLCTTVGVLASNWLLRLKTALCKKKTTTRGAVLVGALLQIHWKPFTVIHCFTDKKRLERIKGLF